MAHTMPPLACEADCEKAHGLLPENGRAWAAWNLVADQVVYAPSGAPVALRIEALTEAVDRVSAGGIGRDEDWWLTLRKLRLGEEVLMGHLRASAEAAARRARAEAETASRAARTAGTGRRLPMARRRFR